MRIKPWYFRIQHNWVIFLQVYVTHFEYWLLSKFSNLAACQNQSRAGGEIFRIWTWGNNIFFPVKRESNGKTISLWTAPKTAFAIVYQEINVKEYSFSFILEEIKVPNSPNSVFRFLEKKVLEFCKTSKTYISALYDKIFC